MTTKDSPRRLIKMQADKIAGMLKAAERGDPLDARFAEKIAEARARRVFKVAIVMDDKVLSIAIPWETVKNTSEAALSEFIVREMQEAKPS